MSVLEAVKAYTEGDYAIAIAEPEDVLDAMWQPSRSGSSVQLGRGSRQGAFCG